MMDEQSKKAFDFAADLTKQLITLSTSIVTLTLLFSKDVLEPRWLAVAVWVVFLISIICGLMALMALTGTLAPLPQPHALDSSKPIPQTPPVVAGGVVPEEPLVIGKNVRICSGAQIILFGLAILMTIGYVIVAISKQKPEPEKPSCKCEVILQK
jgi:hypothetical protein